MSKQEKVKENFLDYIPKQNVRFLWKLNNKERVEVRVKNTGLFKRITQIFFKKPKYSYIELDDLGSFIWQQIDGQRTVYDIGLLVKNKFGQEAEPLFERITEFLHILRRNSFILYLNKLNQKSKGDM